LARPAATASSSAERISGWASSRAAWIAVSFLRSFGSMRGRFTMTARSRRSGRVATFPMPARMMGRLSAKISWSRSVNRVRVLKPPPVAMSQRTLESHGGTWGRLS
jgi:hypothetical protein